MNDSAGVRMGQGTASLFRNAKRLFEGKAMFLRLLQQFRHRPTVDILAHDIGAAPFLAEVVDGHDVGVIA